MDVSCPGILEKGTHLTVFFLILPSVLFKDKLYQGQGSPVGITGSYWSKDSMILMSQ